MCDRFCYVYHAFSPAILVIKGEDGETLGVEATDCVALVALVVPSLTSLEIGDGRL